MATARPIERDSDAPVAVADPPRPAGKPLTYAEKLKARQREMARERALTQAALQDPNAALRRELGLPPPQPPVSAFRFTQSPDPSVVLNEDDTSVCPPGYRQANVPYTNPLDGSAGDGNIRHMMQMGFEVARYKGGKKNGEEVRDILGNVVMIVPDETLIDYMSAKNPNMVSREAFFREKAGVAGLKDIVQHSRGAADSLIDTVQEGTLAEDPDSFS